MSGSRLDYLLTSRGMVRELDGFVVSACFDASGTVASFGMGDGTQHLARVGDTDPWVRHVVHEGGLLALAPDITPGSFISGGDDGFFRRLRANGDIEDIASFGTRWVEHVASFVDAKSGLLACSERKTVHLFDRDGRKLKSLDHPSTVAGIAFDAKGKRVAAAHYNGATLWFVAAKTDSPRKLEWKGSHTGVVIHPDGTSVVTSMQENALHGWRLTDGQNMRMSGYPAKTDFMSFSRNGRWLATSGADAVVLWPFFGGGPMGKSPTELAGGDDVLCSYLATHPAQEAVAAGFNDGLMVLADINNARILPIAAPGRGAVTAVAWSADGTHLAFGTETGFCAVVDFSKR